MKQIKYQTVTETRGKEVGYIHICNCCGKQTTIIHEGQCVSEEDIKNFYVDFGYGSSYDGESWSFDLCNDCLLNLIKTFKHVPDGFQNGNYSLINSKEEHQKVFENWVETGGWNELKFKSYEEITNLNNGWINTDYLNEAIKQHHPGKPLLDEK